MGKTFDFGGYATKVNLKCSDGRTIRKDAFKDCDGAKVPLVWMHLHKSPENVLGHAILEHREDGVYANCSFNNTPMAQHAKEAVMHGDVVSLSIFANNLVEKSKAVIHGVIREVSLVLSGANPGAHIDNLVLEHGDGSSTVYTDEATIYSGLAPELFHADDGEDDEDEDDGVEVEEDEDGEENIEETGEVFHADENEDEDDEKTIIDVYNAMNEEQKEAVMAMVAVAIDEALASVEHSNISNDEGDNIMKWNAFENQGNKPKKGAVLTHDQFQAILEDAKRDGSFRKAFLAHEDDSGEEIAIPYGIEDIEFLFPDARNVTQTPSFISRDMGWVQKVLSATKHSPFSRIKSIHADITEDEARAKGYFKGQKKIEEIFPVLRRVTTPTTIYKKQKLDRDDIIDIVDFDVVIWIKAEMRVMLNEEIARAVLIGDGRAVVDPDKIPEAHIRPIYTDNDLYAYKIDVPEQDSAEKTTKKLIEAMIRNRVHYKGAGNPVLFTTSSVLADMLLLTDTIGRRLYTTDAELKAMIRVSDIVEVPVMEDITRSVVDAVNGNKDYALAAIMVNLVDYTIGADKGGEINFFEDFDIDYNQEKYLLETRISGALTVPNSALVFEVSSTPAAPGGPGGN